MVALYEVGSGYLPPRAVGMNRYQIEVAELERRDRLRNRLLVVSVGLVGLIVIGWAVASKFHRELHVEAAQEGVSSAPNRIARAQEPGSQRAEVSSTAVEITEPRRLYLVEAFPGRNVFQGTARIGVDPRSPQTYVAGAILLNGSRLSEIHAEHVVLERNGERSLLARWSGSANDQEISDLIMVSPAGESAEVPVADDHLSSILRISPVYDGDSLVGLQLYPGSRPGAFQQLGLRSGDLVIAVDGSPVFDARSATMLFQPLIDGGAMQVSVRREQVTETMLLDGSVVSRASAENIHASQPPAQMPPG